MGRTLPERRRIYLDHDAASPPRPEVLDAALPFLLEGWANPHSVHAAGRAAAAAVEDARERVGAWCGAGAGGVVFTSGATEANNLALRGAGDPARPRLLVSAVEHPSVLRPALALGAELLPVDGRGLVRLDALDAALDDRVRLVSVMAANNETGVLQPLDEVAELCRRAGALLHADAAQIPGRLPAPGAWDLLSLCTHKGGGLKGAGALVLRDGVELAPQQLGGAQERGRRAGTVNVPAVVAMGALLSLPPPGGLAALREVLERAGAALGAEIGGAGAPRLPNTVHLSFPGLPGDTLVAGLDLEGVCASSGSACASGASRPSHVLRAMGLDPGSGLRLSVGWNTGISEVERAAELLAVVVGRARAVLGVS